MCGVIPRMCIGSCQVAPYARGRETCATLVGILFFEGGDTVWPRKLPSKTVIIYAMAYGFTDIAPNPNLIRTAHAQKLPLRMSHSAPAHNALRRPATTPCTWWSGRVCTVLQARVCKCAMMCSYGGWVLHIQRRSSSVHRHA